MNNYIVNYFFIVFNFDRVFNHCYFTRFRHKHINVKEIKIVLFIIRKWLNMLREKRLIIHDDNIVVVFDLIKRFIKNAAMILLRNICMLLARNDVTIVSEWIFTEQNTLADLLSREKWFKITDMWSQLRFVILRTTSTSKQI